ncbi:MAG: hypothetical protein E2O67_02150 [Deltaproteobacteria bacterium]|nr:hypothetical protein [Nanoarchaeota archaeon]TDJ07685.1 MAG: hypothetical protein E2O67_02150 [Deltaproteobacteria bacterium]
MKSKATKRFWRFFDKLPIDIQKAAVEQFKIWFSNPAHPSLHFKKVQNYWSARVTEDYRAVGIMDKDTVIWFFIGTHSEYNKLLNKK